MSLKKNRDRERSERYQIRLNSPIYTKSQIIQLCLLSRSEIDLSEAELPEKDLKILELLVARLLVLQIFKTFMANIQLFRRQKTFQDEEDKFYKKQQWLREKEVEDAHRNAFEKERREILAKKRDQEREDFYRRLEEAQKKLLVAQNNLEQVLQKHHQEQRVTFKESSSSKV